MIAEDRQRIMETNKSLRTIKNELESLLEKGVISELAYDSITFQLPAEQRLGGGASTTNRQPTPTTTTTPTTSTTGPSSPPATALANLSIANPPSYNQSTGGSNHTNPVPPPRSPAPPPSKPALAHARATYAYTATDARDVAFQRGDAIAVLEHMNADWWMGRNERTGQEGIFPRSYVELVAAGPAYRDEKVGGYYGGAPQQYGGGYPAPPQAVANPYNAPVPPMAVAEQPQGGQPGSKVGEHGKKIGKKLGNAAIFGAGATIGSNIVNSIF